MRVLRALVLIVVVVSGAVIAWGARRPSGAPPASVPAQRPSSAQSQEIGETVLVLREKGQRRAEIRAAQVQISGDARYARFLGISQAALYGDDAGAVRVRAAEIVLDRHTHDLIVRGPIQVTSPRGDWIRAPEARWVSARQRLVFQGGVALTIAHTIVHASRLVVDLRLQSFDLEGGVDITFRLMEGTP